jgi:hypothetical protein
VHFLAAKKRRELSRELGLRLHLLVELPELLAMVTHGCRRSLDQIGDDRSFHHQVFRAEKHASISAGFDMWRTASADLRCRYARSLLSIMMLNRVKSSDWLSRPEKS